MSKVFWIALMNEISISWIEAIWRACWQGGALAVVVWVISRCWPRISSAWRCRLWWLVCLRLLAGLSPIFLPVPLLPGRATHAEARHSTRRFVPVSVSESSARSRNATPISARESLPGTLRPSMPTWLFILWLAGAGVLMSTTTLSLLRLVFILRASKSATDPALVQIAHTAATEMGCRRTPAVFVTSRDIGVLTVGVWKPVVLLSEQTLAACSQTELKMVLVHEFAHIRRGDIWLGLVPQAAQNLFWFHPLAWLACREFCLDREAACDEQTILTLRAPVDQYGRLLLKLGVRQSAWIPLFTPGVSSHFRVLHRRISMLQHVSERSPRRIRHGFTLAATLICAAVAVPWTIVHAQIAERDTSGSAASSVGHAGLPSAATGTLATAHGSLKLPEGHTVKGAATGRSVQVGALSAKKMNGDSKGSSRKTAIAKAVTVSKIAAPGDNNPGIPGEGGGRAPSELTTRIFRLNYAKAEAVTQSLSILFSDEIGKDFKLVPDTRTNALILRASNDKAEEIAHIIQELDVEAADTVTAHNVRFVRLQHAQADEVAKTLTALFAAEAPNDTKIVPEARTNSIVLQASDLRISEIMNVLRSLDVSK